MGGGTREEGHHAPGDKVARGPVLQFENNYFTEMYSGSEAGSYFRLENSKEERSRQVARGALLL